MPTVISHAVVGSALITAFPPRSVPRRFAILGAVCAMAPDIDVIGFRFGVHYEDFLGHRGLTHSLVFAAVLAFVVQFAAVRRIRPNLLWLYLFLATALHGLLDAFTNGGLGVAFFSPFSNARYFFPITPIAVSPIGVHFFSARGWDVLLNEFRWVWFPSIAFAGLAVFPRNRSRSPG